MHGSGPNVALGRYSGRNHRANFGNDWLRGFSVATGQILGFSIGFRRRPYYTLAQPCESMIGRSSLVCIVGFYLSSRKDAVN